MARKPKKGTMVTAVVSFVGYDAQGKKYRVSVGDEFSLPAGVDWETKGLVVEKKDK
ncbi:MAG: hypothetical protein GY805_04985 [Chloroflexi bacterium]|nr:hypothetical protein [Chloroflexota bacterium]